MKHREQKSPPVLLVNTLGNQSPIMEAFRALRTNIQYTGISSKARVIAVTSTGPDEGKSSVAVNLAAVMAMAGSRCILVDADLRRPVLAGVFGGSGRVGLTNVLLGTTSVEEALSETGIEGFSLLPSGPPPPNPAELVGSGAMGQVLAKLRELTDVVLIDTPPLLPVTDGAILSSAADGVLLVVNSGKTYKQAALRGKQVLEGVQANILGVVLNNTTRENGYSYQYYNSYYTS